MLTADVNADGETVDLPVALKLVNTRTGMIFEFRNTGLVTSLTSARKSQCALLVSVSVVSKECRTVLP